MTKADDAMVRTALFEAANVVLTRVVRWSAKETTVPAALRERGRAAVDPARLLLPDCRWG